MKEFAKSIWEVISICVIAGVATSTVVGWVGGAFYAIQETDIERVTVEGHIKFSGVGTTFPLDHIPITIKEGEYRVVLSPELRDGLRNTVTLVRGRDDARWAWNGEKGGNILAVEWSSTARLYEGDYRLRVNAAPGEEWAVSFTRIRP